MEERGESSEPNKPPGSLTHFGHSSSQVPLHFAHYDTPQYELPAPPHHSAYLLLPVCGGGDHVVVPVDVSWTRRRLKVGTSRVALTWFAFKPDTAPRSVHAGRLKLRPTAVTRTNSSLLKNDHRNFCTVLQEMLQTFRSAMWLTCNALLISQNV